MSNIIEIVNNVLALGIIASQVFIVLTIIYASFPFRENKISTLFSKHAILLAFITSLLASIGSLFYSNYAGFVPCSLCWIQRIIMYIEVILLGIYLIKHKKYIISSALTLSLIGMIISIYHNYIYFSGLRSTVCTTAESCTTAYVFEYGYITLPMMALTTFALISLFLIIKHYANRKRFQ